MNEQTLILAAAITALIGIAGLLFVDELPRVERVGTLVWSNDTAALVLTTQPLWVELEEPTQQRVGSCAQLTGHLSDGRLQNAQITPASPADFRSCP